jgi:peptide/nickel transport system substrate-binding protein
LAAALLFVTGACQGSQPTSSVSATLVIAIPGTPQGTDLDRESGPQTWTIAAQVLELGQEWTRIPYPFPPHGGVDNTQIPNTTYPALQQQQITPGLIQSCDTSADGLTVTYNLRHGAMSAYGNEFTSADVLFRVKRALANNAIGAFLLGAANVKDINQWSAVDKYTVKITSTTPMPLVCPINTNEYWVYLDSKEVLKHATTADPWGNEWVPFHGDGFGPYYITKWTPGQEVDLDANPNYWQGVPKIKHIIYKVVPESANRVALLQSGSVQMSEGLAPQDIISLNGKTGVHVNAVRSSLSIYLVMNNKQAPFDNVKVRQAINYAIPRQDIVSKVYLGLANDWQGIMPSLYPGYTNFTTYTYDIAKAKSLMTEAGYPNGFQTVMTYNAGDPVQSNLGVVLQSSLKQIGIDATLQQQPPGPYSDLVQSKKATFGLWLDFPIQPDLNYSMRLLYLTGNAVNYQNYSNPAVDDILQKCVSESGSTRITCNQAAEKIISDDATLGWITEPDYLIGLSDKLSGWGWYTTQYYHVSSMQFGS